jgi:hypothetical protein
MQKVLILFLLRKNYQTELAEKSCMKLAITVQCQCTSTAV